MNGEYWIDGFNFLRHWDRTRDLFHSGYGGAGDIVRALDQALRIASRELGAKRRAVLVFMDGGLSRCEVRQAGLRVRYCGPGNKADDRMAEDLAGLGGDSRRVIAVSNDRELKTRLAYAGASCLGVGEFLALLSKRRGSAAPGKGGRGGGEGDPAGIMREKCRSLAPTEVRAWLDAFGGDMEG